MLKKGKELRCLVIHLLQTNQYLTIGLQLLDNKQQMLHITIYIITTIAEFICRLMKLQILRPDRIHKK